MDCSVAIDPQVMDDVEANMVRLSPEAPGLRALQDQSNTKMLVMPRTRSGPEAGVIELPNSVV